MEALYKYSAEVAEQPYEFQGKTKAQLDYSTKVILVTTALILGTFFACGVIMGLLLLLK